MGHPGIAGHPMGPGMPHHPGQQGAPNAGIPHQFSGPMVSAPGAQVNPALMGDAVALSTTFPPCEPTLPMIATWEHRPTIIPSWAGLQLSQRTSLRQVNLDDEHRRKVAEEF